MKISGFMKISGLWYCEKCRKLLMVGNIKKTNKKEWDKEKNHYCDDCKGDNKERQRRRQ